MLWISYCNEITTLEKKYSIYFFVEKNDAQISGFEFPKKLEVPERGFFWKNASSFYLCRWDL